MIELSYLTEMETEMVSGGWGRGLAFGSYNDTFTNLVGVDQSSNAIAFASRGGNAGNLQSQISGILNLPVVLGF